jgi:hypothetical protein
MQGFIIVLQTNIILIVRAITQRMLRESENLASMGKTRNACRVLVRQPEGNRKHRREFNDNIEKESKE